MRALRRDARWLPVLRVAVLAAVIFAGLAATPAAAYHDRIYRACSAPWGWVHMTEDQWYCDVVNPA